MENFFYEGVFFSDLYDLSSSIDIDEFNVIELNEDWTIRVELSDLEPIFKIDADYFYQLLINANEDRLLADFDEELNFLNALKQCIDFEKLKEKIPKLYYPNNKFAIITKADLVSLF